MTRKELQDVVFKKYGSKGYVTSREYVVARRNTNFLDPSFGNELFLYLPMRVTIGTAELFGDSVKGEGANYEDAYLDAQKRSPLIWKGI